MVSFLLYLAGNSGFIVLSAILVFSIGEMTAHPKFISYVGQTAPRARVATYMGYIFLYGVIGSSIGSMVGTFIGIPWLGIAIPIQGRSSQ